MKTFVLICIDQLSSYALWHWLIFLLLAASLPLFAALLGVVTAHLVTALAIAFLDASATSDPDFLFALGVIIRAVMINVLLLPVTMSACYLSRRFKLCLFALDD